MSYNIILSESARTDLRNIYEYIAYVLQVPETARRISRKILNAIGTLENMPHRHRIYPEKPMESHEIRSLPIANYLIFYKIAEENNCVLIARIIYGGRDMKKQLIEVDDI